MKCKLLSVSAFLFVLILFSLPQDVTVETNTTESIGEPKTADVLPYIPEVRITDVDEDFNEITVEPSFTMLDQGANPGIGMDYNVTNSIAYVFHVEHDNYDSIDDWALEQYLYLNAVVLACHWSPDNWSEVFPDATAILYNEFETFQTDIDFGPYSYDDVNISRVELGEFVLDDEHHHSFAMFYLNWTAPLTITLDEPLGLSIVTISRDEIKSMVEDKELVENTYITEVSEDLYLWIAQYGWIAFVGILASLAAVVIYTRKDNMLR